MGDIDKSRNKRRWLEPKLKRQVQMSLLHDESFVKSIFSQIEHYNLELVNRPRPKSTRYKEIISVPAEEVMTKIINRHVELYDDFNDTTMVLFNLIGMVAANCAILRKDIRELANAFAIQDKREQKLLKLSQRFQMEEEEFQNAIKNAKELTKVCTWLKRAIEDSKNNDVV